MADFSYDLSTDVGQVREWLTDTDETNFVFTDKSLNYYLSLANSKKAYTAPATLNQILLAASSALEINATKLAALASIEKIAIFQENTVVTYDSILAQALRLKVLAGQQLPPSVSTPDNFYTLNNESANPFTTDLTKPQPSSNLGAW